MGQRRREAATLRQGGAGEGWEEHLPEEAPWRPGKAYLAGEKRFEGKQTFSRRQLRKTNIIVMDKKQLQHLQCHTLCLVCFGPYRSQTVAVGEGGAVSYWEEARGGGGDPAA